MCRLDFLHLLVLNLELSLSQSQWRLLNLSQKTLRRQIPDLIKTVTDLSMHVLDLLSVCLGVVLKAKKVKNANSVISVSN